MRDRPALDSDLSFIESLLREAAESAPRGIGYPRCRDLPQLEAELLLFQQEPKTAFFVLEETGHAVGVHGILRAPGSTGGFLVGPLMLAAPDSQSLLREAVALAERRAGGMTRLRASARIENEELAAALAASGWIRAERYIEMWHRLGPSGIESRKAVQTISPDSNVGVRSAADLFRRVHGWSTDAEAQLRRYLVDGYALEAVVGDGGIEAAMLWQGHSGRREARIEWVCTEHIRQRSGCGRALVAHALTEARHRGLSAAWLTVREDNLEACALFTSCGFAPEARSQIFTKALPNANS